jgi:hypothetical protein
VWEPEGARQCSTTRIHSFMSNSEVACRSLDAGGVKGTALLLSGGVLALSINLLFCATGSQENEVGLAMAAMLEC